MSIVRRAWSEAVIVGLLASLPILINIDAPAIYQWDEARLALNALEMMQSSNPLVVTYRGEPDLWNAKPPLAIWLAAGSMKLLGVNELALRLPAALAAIATVIAVAMFTRRVSHSRTTGLIAALALLGIGGFVEIHVARTADYDAYLVLFMTLATFSAYRAIRLASRCTLATTSIYQASAFFIAALLTKGVAALLILPGWGAFALATRKSRLLARCPATEVAIVSALAVMIAFLAARELAYPGFLAAVGQDTWGRLTGSPDQLTGPWHYYVKGLVLPWQGILLHPSAQLPYMMSAFPWSPVLILIPLAWQSRRKNIAQATKYVTLCLLAFLLAISAATTKLPWYVAPAYPLIAVLAALSVHELAGRAREENIAFGRSLTAAALLSGLLLWGMTTVKAERAARESRNFQEQKLPTFLREHLGSLPATSKIRVVNNGESFVPRISNGAIDGTERYDGASEFYVRVARDRGRDIRLVLPGYPQQADEIILGCRDMRDYAGLVAIRSGDCVAKLPRPG